MCNKPCEGLYTVRPSPLPNSLPVARNRSVISAKVLIGTLCGEQLSGMSTPTNTVKAIPLYWCRDGVDCINDGGGYMGAQRM